MMVTMMISTIVLRKQLFVFNFSLPVLLPRRSEPIFGRQWGRRRRFLTMIFLTVAVVSSTAGRRRRRKTILGKFCTFCGDFTLKALPRFTCKAFRPKAWTLTLKTV
uniref:Secreted protein n=1 Tax=Romanomermis culicivorax TaxID=13658 RepID=A0A915IJS6_ROMCU